MFVESSAGPRLLARSMEYGAQIFLRLEHRSGLLHESYYAHFRLYILYGLALTRISFET